MRAQRCTFYLLLFTLNPQWRVSQSPSILFINQHYWTDWAAMAQMPTHLAECLAAEGMDLHVLCSRGHYLLGPTTRRGPTGLRGRHCAEIGTIG